MIFEFVLELLKMCEYLENYKIRCNMLDRTDNSVSVVPKGDFKTIKRYCDGSQIQGVEFDIVLRLDFNGDGTQTFNFLQNFEEWLINIDFSKYRDLTDKYARGFTPVMMTVTKGAYLADDDIHSGKYKIGCRLNCLKI